MAVTFIILFLSQGWTNYSWLCEGHSNNSTFTFIGIFQLLYVLFLTSNFISSVGVEMAFCFPVDKQVETYVDNRDE